MQKLNGQVRKERGIFTATEDWFLKYSLSSLYLVTWEQGHESRWWSSPSSPIGPGPFLRQCRSDGCRETPHTGGFWPSSRLIDSRRAGREGDFQPVTRRMHTLRHCWEQQPLQYIPRRPWQAGWVGSRGAVRSEQQ